jgi:hypothetical protein
MQGISVERDYFHRIRTTLQDKTYVTNSTNAYYESLKRPMDLLVSVRRPINIAQNRDKTTTLTSRAFSRASNTNPGSGKDANRCSLYTFRA